MRISARARARVRPSVHPAMRACIRARLLLLSCSNESETPAAHSRLFSLSFSLYPSRDSSLSFSFTTTSSSPVLLLFLLAARASSHSRWSCRTVIRSLSISREEANRPLQTLFSFADARRPSLMKSHTAAARTHKCTHIYTHTHGRRREIESACEGRRRESSLAVCVPRF